MSSTDPAATTCPPNEPSSATDPTTRNVNRSVHPATSWIQSSPRRLGGMSEAAYRTVGTSGSPSRRLAASLACAVAGRCSRISAPLGTRTTRAGSSRYRPSISSRSAALTVTTRSARAAARASIIWMYRSQREPMERRAACAHDPNFSASTLWHESTSRAPWLCRRQCSNCQGNSTRATSAHASSCPSSAGRASLSARPLSTGAPRHARRPGSRASHASGWAYRNSRYVDARARSSTSSRNEKSPSTCENCRTSCRRLSSRRRL